MKIHLPFNFLPHLEGTAIAASFGLKNRPPEHHTVIELTRRDTQDLLQLLTALETELHGRCLKWQKQASKAPVVAARRSGVEQDRQMVRRAIELIEDALSVAEKVKV